jgi:hypothetical protein
LVSALVPSVRLSFLGATTAGGAITAGILDDVSQAADLRDRSLFPPTSMKAPVTAILDLGGVQPTGAVLRELVVPLGQRLLGGTYGNVKVVVAAPDDAVAELIRLLAREYRLPLFLARTSRPEDVATAEPIGNLTTAELQTLESLNAVGGMSTVSGFAGATGLAATAANNRLTGLDRKGYVHRLVRGRRYGDVFVDPRAPISDELIANAMHPEIPPARDALLRGGIVDDPYARTRIALGGEAADRASEILRRRGKLEQ